MGRLQTVLCVGVLCLATPPGASAQRGDGPINEDEFFGARMREHRQGQGLYQEPQGRGGYMLLFGALAGVGLEWFWTGRSIKKEMARHVEMDEEFVRQWKLDREAIMAKRTYPVKLLANKVEEADLQLEQLAAAAEDAGVDMGLGFRTGAGGRMRTTAQDLEDYEEFKQPDANNDNVITKAEFNQYIRGYLRMYPETPQSDVPRFEEFDVNRDGVVTFDEWQHYLDTHRQAEQVRENEMLRGMYDNSASAQGFGQMANNMRAGHGRY